MTLKETINNDLKNAMRARNQNIVDTLRMLLAAIQQIEIKTRANLSAKQSELNNEINQSESAAGVLTDQEIIDVINKLIKQRRESYEIYIKAQRTELAETEAREIEILQIYQPKQLTEIELISAIKQLLDTNPEATSKDFGKLFGQLKQQYAGRVDWGLASQKLKLALQEKQ